MRKLSLKYRVLFVVILIQLPFWIAFPLYIKQVAQNVNKQLAIGHADSLASFCTSLRDEFLYFDRFLTHNVWADEGFRAATGAANTAQAEAELAATWEKGEELFSNTKNAMAIFFTLPGARGQLALANSAKVLSSDSLQQYARLLDEETLAIDGWTLLTGGHTPCMARTIRYQGAFCTVLVDIGAASRNAQTEYRLSSPVVFYDGKTRLTDAMWVREYTEKNGSVFERGDDYTILACGGKKYLVVSRPFLMMHIDYAVPYHYDWQWLNLAIVIFCAITALALAAAWLYLRSTFFKPLDRLIWVMQRIRDGNLTARAEDFKNTEFSEINKIFNQMIDNIETLKIEAYENRLAANNSLLDSLRLQIRRHFFLNCLKNIYGMSQSGDLEDIRTMVLLLSNHLRYTLDLREHLVPLQTELLMCQNYIDLQGVGQQSKPSFQASCDANLTDFTIPPVSVLTLVENCCKYGMLLDRSLAVIVDITVHRTAEEGFVTITVQDNGNGFDEEALRQLNSESGRILMNQEGHIGIANVLTRMRMIYGEKCSAMFSNAGGAKIELIIPIGGEMA